jgi:acetone carboxylase alpha subunit
MRARAASRGKSAKAVKVVKKAKTAKRMAKTKPARARKAAPMKVKPATPVAPAKPAKTRKATRAKAATAKRVAKAKPAKVRTASRAKAARPARSPRVIRAQSKRPARRTKTTARAVRAPAPRLTLKEQLALDARLFRETGHLFGLKQLRRKQEDPGTYEAVWHILLNGMNAAWTVGCKVSASPVAAEGGDAVWNLHLPTGEAVCSSKGIVSHPGLLSMLLRSYIENDYEQNPGFRPGDIWENNDPHYGGIHSVDFQTALPIFHDGELIAWASSVSHVMDGGMILPGSIGFMNPDSFCDGVPVVMERVGENDNLYPWYEKRIQCKTRVPDWVMGDARGRLAGCLTVRDKLLAVIEKYGADYVKDALREYVEDSRRYATLRVKTQAVPGRVRKSSFKDLAMAGKRVIKPEQNLDCLFNLPMEVTIGADAKVRFSLRGASSWVPFGENITPKALISALLNGYSHMVGFDMFNWGAVAAWELENPPEGSWANPFPVNYFASSGVAWAPAVIWLSGLYETFGRLYFARGYIEEVAAGAGTTLTGEFSGINQQGVYVAGMTLEQACNGAPARGMADGENSAWCIYTPNADFGNAEVSELYYPILYLGRNLEPDSGGYGKFRGGLGHTVVWMIKNTSGVEYACGDAGMRSKLVANHGMFGAYPAVPDRPSYAAGTNVKELIEAGKPLVHERGDPEDPTLAKNVRARLLETNGVAPFVTSEQLTDYDLVIHPISGAQSLGDPIERDPESVRSDLENGWTRERVAADVYGVVAKQNGHAGDWTVDEAATAERRKEIRATRRARAVPFQEWWRQERERIRAGENMSPAVVDMWRSSMRLSPGYAAELRAFWNLPADFTF